MFVTSESPDEMYAINVFQYCVVTPLLSFCKPLFQSDSLLLTKNSGKILHCHMRKGGFLNRN